MSAINPDAQRALTEKRGKELDRWIEMKCVRFMSGIEPFSPTLSDLPTEIIHHVVEKMEPVDIASSHEVCRSMRNVVNKFAISYGGITLFLRNYTVSKHTSPTGMPAYITNRFSGMPTKIINQVVEKETMDRLRARKVCRSFRAAVDEFGLRFDYIAFVLMKDKVEIWWSGTKIIYTKAANGSTNVFHNKQTKLIDGENFVERAAKDFKILSKHARKIDIRNYAGNRWDIVTTFIKIFKAEKCFHVKEITTFGFDEVLTILSWFDAKELKTIELTWMESIDRFERITQLEQWKNAEVVKIDYSVIASTIIVHFFHFKCFTINHTDEFPAQAAIQMRDDLLKRSTFQGCEISFEKTKANPIEIAKVFKPDYTGGNEFKIEFSNGNDKFDISLRKFYSNHFQLNVKRL